MQLELLKSSYKFLNHASIYLNKGIYIDPYLIKEASHDAKYIFITHPHFDHLSTSDILKVMSEDTLIIATKDSILKLKEEGFTNRFLEVEVNKEYALNDIRFKTVPAYNLNKPFHPLNNGWLGYVITINNITYYIVGDSDYFEWMNTIKCDVLFVPIGGKYTMDYFDASKLTNMIKPSLVVPIHYNTFEDIKVNLKDFFDLVENF